MTDHIPSPDEQIAETEPCPTCDGCGQLADTDTREPWTTWTALPIHSAVAVDLGIVKPIECDDCDGTGQQKSTEEPT